MTAIAAMAGLLPVDIVNKRSPGFRQLNAEIKDDAHALAIIAANPKIMIRPALVVDGKATFGFSEDRFQQLVG